MLNPCTNSTVFLTDIMQPDVETSLATVCRHEPKSPQINEAKPRLTSPPDNSGIQTSKEVPIAIANHQVNDSPEPDLPRSHVHPRCSLAVNSTGNPCTRPTPDPRFHQKTGRRMSSEICKVIRINHDKSDVFRFGPGNPGAPEVQRLGGLGSWQ